MTATKKKAEVYVHIEGQELTSPLLTFLADPAFHSLAYLRVVSGGFILGQCRPLSDLVKVGQQHLSAVPRVVVT